MFTAVVPPAAVVESLEVFVAPRRDAEPDLRWVRPENWHVTLAFMAAVGDDQREGLEELTEQAAQRTPPFRLELEGGGCFPSAHTARQVFWSVSDGAESLARASKTLRQAYNRQGIGVAGGRFVPHLTLARVRRPQEVSRWLRVIDSFPAQSWVVREIVLVESRLSRGGSLYTRVGSFRLAG